VEAGVEVGRPIKRCGLEVAGSKSFSDQEPVGRSSALFRLNAFAGERSAVSKR